MKKRTLLMMFAVIASVTSMQATTVASAAPAARHDASAQLRPNTMYNAEQEAFLKKVEAYQRLRLGLAPVGLLGELAGTMALTSDNASMHSLGAMAEQAGGLADIASYLGPDSIYHGAYRIPERWERISRAQELAKVVKGMSAKKREALTARRNKLLALLGVDGLLRAAEVAGVGPAALISMIVGWKRHSMMRAEYNKLLALANEGPDSDDDDDDDDHDYEDDDDDDE